MTSPDIIIINCHGFKSNSALDMSGTLDYATIDSLKYQKATEFLFLLSCYSMLRGSSNNNTSSADHFSRRISGLTIGSEGSVDYYPSTMKIILNKQWRVNKGGRRIGTHKLNETVSFENMLCSYMYSAYWYKWLKF